MAVYFQLFHIGQSTPVAFQEVDNAICQNLGFNWSETKYACGWYDVIGFALACGKTLPQIVETLRQQSEDCPAGPWLDSYYNLIRIAHFMLERYTTSAWAGR